MVKPLHVAVAAAVVIGGIGIVVAGQTDSAPQVKPDTVKSGLRLERCMDDACEMATPVKASHKQQTLRTPQAVKPSADTPVSANQRRLTAKRIRREREAQVSNAASMLKQGSGKTKASANARPPADRRNDPPPPTQEEPRRELDE